MQPSLGCDLMCFVYLKGLERSHRRAPRGTQTPVCWGTLWPQLGTEHGLVAKETGGFQPLMPMCPAAQSSAQKLLFILLVFRKTQFCRLLFLYLDTNPLGILKGNKQFPGTQGVTFANCHKPLQPFCVKLFDPSSSNEKGKEKLQQL